MNTFIIPMLAFWLLGLVHCLSNTKLQGEDKLRWTLFILFTSSIGSFSYFVYWYGFAKKKARQSELQPNHRPFGESHTFSEQSHQSPGESFTSYEQGYQPVLRPMPSGSQMKSFTTNVVEQESVDTSLYEQPQVMYPEDPR